jgi:hypothetical protein
VVAGTLSAEIDGRQIQVATGGAGTFPAGSAHRWWNDGVELLRFEGIAAPALDLDRYLQAVFEVLNSGEPERPSLFYMVHAAWRHRHTQVVLFAPRAVQMILVPVLVMLGTLLGRYRGADWPGSPSRCTGAPLVAADLLADQLS